MMREPVALPEPARKKLSELTLARMTAEDAGRAANARLNGLPRDADRQLQARLGEERDKHNHRHFQLTQLLSRINQWLMELRGAVLEPVQVVGIKLAPGETLSGAIVAVRSQIRAVREKLGVAKSSPLPLEDRKKCAEEFVTKLAGTTRPRIGFNVHDQLTLRWHDDIITSRDDVLACLAWAAPEVVRATLEREIAAMPVPVNPLTRAERLQRVAELEKTLVGLELHEELLICRACEEGLTVDRRPDASPAAVLQVVVAKAKAKATHVA